ncbi:trimeric intracellular cation channel family protein [Pistricoccus aurantiacus]|uniref:Trimeric intracellular cation channel family protein n=1 Tax=Pistricoccus aurantiacus TaxID=1883414 RepID=A0A5B8SRH1_9GAMM|nr:trimeric intracellular cation channel family protein [Pistricoccus aurantiacus]QEA37743.1 trimeric intracellular cation channel family protein [Pistricoccus aurantiacus]
MSGLIYWLDLAGVTIFAFSGVIIACQSRMDPFGMLVLGAVTGIGGGTLRDLVLGVPVFWVAAPSYLWVILATVSLSILGFHYIHRLTRTFLPVTDAFGLALFTVIGSHKALVLGHAGIVAVLMGLMTGVAGGMTRDLLAHRVPMVLRQEIYATASIAGGVVYAGLFTVGLNHVPAIGLALATTLGMRLAAIYWGLSLPTFAWVESPEAPKKEAETGLSLPTRRKARVKMIRPEQSRRRKR